MDELTILLEKCRKKHKRYSLYCSKCVNFSICWEFEDLINFILNINDLRSCLFEDFKGNFEIIHLK